jgi:dolichyl-phosphate-mannose--protein O-mannosyl transferase
MTPLQIFRCGSAALIVLAAVLFFYDLGTPLKVDYDEFHYIPAARAMLDGHLINREHPPLAKYFFATSLAAFGDTPTTWRVPSVVFGLATLAGVLELAWVFFPNPFWALFVGLMTLFNFVLFVQARIAMLDTIMTAFLIWACVYTVKTTRDPKLYNFVWVGVFFGFAMAAKWAAIPTFALCLLLLATQNWRWSVTAGAVALTAYFVTFFPLMALNKEDIGLLRIFTLQKEMWDLHMSLHAPHGYSSHWWQWPLLLRPMWYAFDRDGDSVRGVFLVGNPLIFWLGFPAVLAFIFEKFDRYSNEFLILFLYCSLYLPWIAFPRATAFFYYYYPAALMLSPAIVQHLQKWERRYPHLKLWACIFMVFCFSLFIDFYPILAGTPLPPTMFQRWVWFRTWL